MLALVFLSLILPFPIGVGIGMSAGAIIFGEIARTSLKKERTAVFALFMSTRQFGLVIGEQSNDRGRGRVPLSASCFGVGVISEMIKLCFETKLVSVQLLHI